MLLEKGRRGAPPAAKKQKRAAPNSTLVTPTATPTATLAPNDTVVNDANDKDTSQQDRPSKAHIAKRLDWVQENECFLSAVRTNMKKKNWNRVNVFEKMESRDSA
jgi:hypothetical protein